MSLSATDPTSSVGGGCTTTRTTSMNVTFSDVDNFTGTEVVFHDGVVGCTCTWIVPIVGSRR